MREFKHNVCLHNTELTLYFSTIAGCTRKKYFVEVIHENRLVTTFDMAKEESKGWKVLPPAKEWVMDMQEKIARAASYFETTKA